MQTLEMHPTEVLLYDYHIEEKISIIWAAEKKLILDG